MKNKFYSLPLRKGVGIVLLNNKNKVFVAKRIDNPKNFWQMPQGGVDGDENYYEAALRELKEETSVVSVKLIQEIDKKLTYILPNHLIGIIWRGKFKGQTQKWFIMRFLGEESCIGVKMHGGAISRLINDIDIACLASNLPEYLEVDIADLDVGDSIFLSGLSLPEGVEIPSLALGEDRDQAVVSVTEAKVLDIEPEVVETEGEDGESQDGDGDSGDSSESQEEDNE